MLYANNLHYQFKPVAAQPFQCGEQQLDLARPNIMGIINTGSASFCGKNRITSDPQSALACAKDMHASGATIIDIGGEPTNPNLAKLKQDPQAEIDRVVPVIELIHRELDVVISIDTSSPFVMQAAVQAGANMINDVRALRMPGALAMAAKLAVPIVLMHMSHVHGVANSDHKQSHNSIAAIKSFLITRRQVCIEAGIAASQIMLDPGFGGGSFGKSDNENLAIIHHVNEFVALGSPVLIGVSRKSTIGNILDLAVADRLVGGIALAVMAISHGARIIRTHDVKETAQAVRIAQAVLEEE